MPECKAPLLILYSVKNLTILSAVSFEFVNMIADFAGKIKSMLPKDVELHSLRLYETASAWAEWFAEDNAV